MVGAALIDCVEEQVGVDQQGITSRPAAVVKIVRRRPRRGVQLGDRVSASSRSGALEHLERLSDIVDGDPKAERHRALLEGRALRRSSLVRAG